ncbi:MAG: hypothetical protein FWE02_04430 [Defluviitaleaceae bacterium]|nr:hypothetical protein [Defluviitaleaceae bacterium]
MSYDALLEIATADLTQRIGVPEKTPLWRFVLWVEEYEQNIQAVIDIDFEMYTQQKLFILQLYVEEHEYTEVFTYENCFNREKTFYVEKNIMYIHYENHEPAYFYYNTVLKIKQGYSMKKATTIDDLTYLPLLKPLNEISEQVDSLSGNQFVFSTLELQLDNSQNTFDKTELFNGNKCILYFYKEGQPKQILTSMLINSVNYDVDIVRLSLIDLRASWNTKLPKDRYTVEEYPFLADNKKDKIKQEAYGFCFGIMGVCINERQIFSELDPLIKITHYKYRFANKIKQSNIVRIEAKMSNDTWIEIFPGLGVPGFTDELADNRYRPINPWPVIFYEDMGIVEVYYQQALPDGEYGKTPNQIRAYGRFGEVSKPADIIFDLFEKYTNIPISNMYFNIEEIRAELDGLPDIGIVLNEERELFTWLEELQNRSLISFQLGYHQDLITARLNNPNRATFRGITSFEQLTLVSTEIDVNSDAFASTIKVQHNTDYSDNELTQFFIDTENMRPVLIKYYKENEYSTICETGYLRRDNTNPIFPQYIRENNYVALKSRILGEQLVTAPLIIKNIKLFGIDSLLGLRVFDILFIDFSFVNENVQNSNVLLFKYLKKRNLLGRMRVKIIETQKDYNNLITTITVIQQDLIKTLPIPTIEISFSDNIIISDVVIRTTEENYEDTLLHSYLRDGHHFRNNTISRKPRKINDTLQIKEHKE